MPARSAALAVAAAALALGGCRRGPPPGPNLVLVTVETFRADHLGAVRDGVPLTPRIDAIAERGTTFENAYSASAFTLPSLHTIATGMPPTVHRVRFWTHFGNRYRGPTLAGTLGEEGLATAFLWSSYSQLTPYPILQAGWGETREHLQEEAAPVLAAAREWLDRNGSGRFFLWVHLFEPHTPYGPDERFVEGLADVAAYRAAGPAAWPVEEWLDSVPGGGGEQLADALYAADVRAADAAVGELWDELVRRGLAGSTVVCIAGDHGENLSRDPEPRWDHGWSLDPQQIRVPLVVVGPGVPAGRRETDIARHLDLAPTLVRRLGFEPPPDWPGRDLFGPAPPPSHVIAESTVATQQDAPFYTVTDGESSLRIFTDPLGGAPRILLAAERPGGAEPRPVDPTRPPREAAPFLAAWEERGRLVERLAPRWNAPGSDLQQLTETQRRLLEQGGYLR